MKDILLHPTVFGGMVVLAFALVRLVDFLIKKLMKKKEDEETKSCLTEKEKQMLKSLYDMHQLRDENGVPIWYMPRDWSAMQKELGQTLTKISITQEKTTYVLESMLKQIEHLTYRLDDKINNQ